MAKPPKIHRRKGRAKTKAICRNLKVKATTTDPDLVTCQWCLAGRRPGGDNRKSPREKPQAQIPGEKLTAGEALDELGEAIEAAGGVVRLTPKNKGGRPRKSRYYDAFADLGDPPDDPLRRAQWAQSILCRALFETIQGRGNREANAEIRAFAAGIKGLIPAERIMEAEKRILGALAPRKPRIKKGQKTVKAGPTRRGVGGPIRG